jgi:DNA-binding MarR family transcriptional regulator
MFYLRDLPSPEFLRAYSQRYGNMAPVACEAFLVLLRIASDVAAGFDGYLEENGLSQGRFTVMMILNRNPAVGLSPSDLAERAGVTRATMTGLLDGLENEGLVTRSAHAQDRRMLTVRLTEGGLRRLDDMLPEYFRRISALLGDLDEDEQRTLTKLLRGVGARVGEMAGQPLATGA